MTDTTTKPEPTRPTMPEARMMLETIAGDLWFDNQAELDAWRKEPFWRKMLGLTAYDRKFRKPR